MLRAGGVRRDERQVDLAGRHAGQLDLCLFCGFLQSLHGHLVAGEVDAVLLLEGGNHPIDDALIEVVAAQAVVASGCKHFLHAVAHLDDGDIERAAAEVIHHDLLLFALVDAIGQSRGRRLVDDTLYIQARDLAGVLGRLALCVGEVCRDGDNSGADGFAQIGFCVRLQLLQDHCGNLLRGVALIVNRYFIIGTHLSLDGRNGAVRVGDGLALCHLAHHTLAGLGERDHGRRCARAFCVWNYNRLAAFNHGYTGIRCTKVNTNCLAHNLYLQFSFCFFS